MGGEIIEKALVVGALAILKTFELNLPRLLFFGVVNLFAKVGEVSRTEMIEDVKLKSPDDIGGVLDVARFLEALEGDGLHVVLPIERADDEKGSVSVALKFFELANRIINAELGGVFGVGNDLEVVETNDGSVGFVGTERLEQREQVVNRFVLKFQNAEIEFGGGEIVNDVFKLNRPRAASNVGSS